MMHFPGRNESMYLLLYKIFSDDKCRSLYNVELFVSVHSTPNFPPHKVWGGSMSDKLFWCRGGCCRACSILWRKNTPSFRQLYLILNWSIMIHLKLKNAWSSQPRCIFHICRKSLKTFYGCRILHNIKVSDCSSIVVIFTRLLLWLKMEAMILWPIISTWTSFTHSNSESDLWWLYGLTPDGHHHNARRGCCCCFFHLSFFAGLEISLIYEVTANIRGRRMMVIKSVNIILCLVPLPHSFTYGLLFLLGNSCPLFWEKRTF